VGLISPQEREETMKDKEKLIIEGAFDEGYTASEASLIVSHNSNKKVTPMDIRKLAEKGVFDSILKTKTMRLYNKPQVNNYIAEDRGVKAGRAAKERARSKKSDK
jgi:hypothetical protein